jgi:hypothetical protein
MNWKAQLDSMKGKTFAHHGQPETVVKYIAHDESRVEILTDAEDYEMPASEVPAFLASFLPVARPAKRTATSPAPFVATVSDTSKLQLMQDALMNALGKVQQDQSFVPQAEQVSKLVQVGINLARLELDAIRLSRA